MKIGYFGDGPWAHDALERVIAAGHSIEFIVARYGTKDAVLKALSEHYKIPYYIFKNVNAEDALNVFDGYQVDLMVSMSFDQILRERIINLAPKGFINCHAGALPFYRGRNPLNWVLINGENEFGISVHYIDAGIDTGDIILQRQYPIQSEDDYANLLATAIAECPKLLVEAIDQIKNGSVTRKRQHEICATGSYFRKRKIGDENIDFKLSAKKCYNLIRGVNYPGPSARFDFGGKAFKILSAKVWEDTSEIYSLPGQVTNISGNGNIVGTGQGFLLIEKICEVGENAIPRIADFQIGSILTSPSDEN